ALEESALRVPESGLLAELLLRDDGGSRDGLRLRALALELLDLRAEPARLLGARGPRLVERRGEVALLRLRLLGLGPERLRLGLEAHARRLRPLEEERRALGLLRPLLERLGELGSLAARLVALGHERGE